MRTTVLAFSALLCMGSLSASAQADMKIGGTIRAKYEYQTNEKEGRFQVRNARINVNGNINSYLRPNKSGKGVRGR